MFFQERANDPLLDALAAAVDEADLIDASPPTLLKVLLDHARNVLGRKDVQIDGILYGENKRLAKGGVS